MNASTMNPDPVAGDVDAARAAAQLRDEIPHASLRVDGVVKRYGEHTVIHGVSLAARPGEFVVFVGPSGCGKSTLLRLVAGLEEVSDGTISIAGEDVTHTPPADRGVSMVFQSYALYPHMTVRDNMAFGLKMIKTPQAEIERRVRQAAAILKLDALMDRRPRQLSGGQRQRVAIGRSIVRNPKLFLFDEPLSNLDAELRSEMRVEIARLHQELGVTMVYVTHDQVEAMTLADRIVVLRAGRIEQIGSPAELYDRPANTFVAGFIGSPKMNFLPARVEAAGPGRLRIGHPAFAGGAVELDPGDFGARAAALAPGQSVTLGVRPENLSIAPAGDGAAGLGLDVRTEYVENLGGTSQLYAVTADGVRLAAVVPGRLDAPAGRPVQLSAAPRHVYLFDEAGLAIR